MKKLTTVVAVAALCCAAFGEGEGAAQAPARREGPRPSPMMRADGGAMAMEPILRMAMNPKSAEKLGITEEQAAKLKALGPAATANRAATDKVRDAMHRQTALMSAEKIDEKAVMASIDEVFELRKEMAKAQAKRVIAVRSILTPEQIQKATEELKATRGAYRPGQRGEGMRGPRGGGKNPQRRPEGGNPPPKPEGGAPAPAAD